MDRAAESVSARPSLRASLGAALRIARVQLRLSLLLSLQYRWDFIGQGAMQLLWLVLSAVPLLVAYKARAAALGGDLLTTEISGWGFYPAAMVFGFFFLLKAVLDGVINPSLVSAVDQIRKGTLDFLLLKPADAQLLVSLARLEPWHALNGMAALIIIAFAAREHALTSGLQPSAPSLLLAVATAALLFVAGVIVLYSLWLLVVCAAFYVVRIDNLSYLLMSLFDFARWPRAVFRGFAHVLFTYLIPLAVMTSFPVDALLGRLGPGQAAWAAAAALGLLWLSRQVWRRSVARYTSASS
ncbi:MAG: ABC-2 family transporter protein [Polyangia bacterium]